MTRDPRTDPTRMANQPSLTTSSGTVWIVIGALFLLASAYPLSALLWFDPGESFIVALITAVGMIVLYALLLVTRFTAPAGRRRLRRMAVFFIAMAALAVVGLLVCAAIELPRLT